MARPLVWLSLLLCAACSKNPPGGTDGNPDGPLPGFDVPPPMGLFPLGISSDRGSLVAADGKPFLLHGEAAWSLIVRLDTDDATRYLADRRDRGVNTLLVNLIESFYSARPPRNAAGDEPFTTPGDFSTPNEAYFAHADRVIDLAASQGMAVLLVPAYLGFEGGEEGWYQEMSAPLTAAPCLSYGDFLGRRYASKSNIIWVWGGDYTPPAGRGLNCLIAIRDGVRQAGATQLSSAHWAPETTSLEVPAFAGSVDIVGVYTYQPVLPACRDARAVFPRKPTYMFETCYENDPFNRCTGKGEVRRQHWWGLLGCGAGELYGVSGLWQFLPDEWRQKLDSPLSLHAQRLAAITQPLPIYTFALHNALVTSDRGTGVNEIVVARSSDRAHALLYSPPAPPAGSTITLDLMQMSGPVTATWLDPTADRSVAAGTNLTGSQTLTRPGANDAGDQDWVLMLSVP
jgi:hypothetical protein